VLAPTPLEAIPAARRRLDTAAADFHAGVAPWVIASGGSVHPDGTPWNEALMMRAYLIQRGVPPGRILVDPYARHSTTNLRNAGRLMRALGLTRGLIVTGYERAFASQAFYFGHPMLSGFHARCDRELGYRVGDLRRLDEHHIRYTPSPAVELPNFRDPLDP
jgi:hypothetical protein